MDALDALKSLNKYEDIPSLSEVKKNLSLESNSKSLITIKLISDNAELNPILLNLLNSEFINDRRNFIKQSSAAGKNFVQRNSEN